MVTAKEIDRTLNQHWGNFESIEFDEDTKQYIENFIVEYNARIRRGLLDFQINVEEKKKMYSQRW